MANPTLVNYFGATLDGLITANAAAIETDLGLQAGEGTDPDKLGAALLVKIRDWLLTDATDDPGLAINTFGDTTYTKGTGTGDRAGQTSYELPFLIWVTDQNPATPPLSDVV